MDEIKLSLSKWELVAEVPKETEKENTLEPAAKEKKQSELHQEEKRPIEIHKTDKEMLIRNKYEKGIELHYNEDLRISEKKYCNLGIRFVGENLGNGGACVYVNGHPVPLNSEVSMELTPPIRLNLTMTVPASSAVRIEKVEFLLREKQKDLVDDCNTESDVLVITPDYPSTHNLYLCAFAHARNREYIKQGLNVQVASISPFAWYQTKYVWDGLPVFTGRSQDLKKLISRHQYKTIVVHFVDEYLYPILDGYVQDERMIFICHGPETTFRFLTNRCRPYFTKELPEIDSSEHFDIREHYVRRYAQKDNVDWVFVSEWLRDFSEKMLGVTFKHSHVIYNTINEKLFPYHKKTAEDRKKILILRKFDNIRVHSIDQSVQAIQELSHRDFFEDLTFEVYGDGNYYDVLTAPLEKYHNVHLHQTFIPNNQIQALHAENGILLIPSRHDTQGVAMCEAASSGLVVVGSNVTTVGYFMNQEANHTLADPENPVELADIIERLYRNPDEYLEISDRMSRETQERCCRANTVDKEVALIRQRCEDGSRPKQPLNLHPCDNPVLTIVVPAYNIETYIDKCIHSLISHRNVEKTEIILVNDGSKDNTLEKARYYEQATNGVVRVIDKENGGHGSTINAGIAAAKGKYFRLIDGDDWVDSENLAILVDKLEHEETDLILTKGCYEYAEQAELRNIVDYDMMTVGRTYSFETLVYPGYGFDGYGPLLTTGNYRTELLKKANFHISEKCPYVDMEFNSFSIRYVKTVKYYPLDIYRYLIGREGQTVSRDFWKSHYQKHAYVIFNILKTLDTMEDYSVEKRQYVYDHLTAAMIDSQIFMFDQLCLWKEIDEFLDKLKQWPNARKAGLELIEAKQGNCKDILKYYKQRISENSKNPVPIINKDGSLAITSKKDSRSVLWYLKKAVKACVPYGIMRIYQKKRYPGL